MALAAFFGWLHGSLGAALECMTVKAVCAGRTHAMNKLALMAGVAFTRCDLKTVQLTCMARRTVDVMHEYMACMTV